MLELARIRAALFVLTLLIAPAAFALELGDAKAQGLVGEQADGYLGAVGSPSAEVQALIVRVNDGRKAKYASIAKQNGIEMTDVEKLAGKKAIERTAAGGYVKPDGGGWVKK